ncbi:class I SAM-dependent methyltransferase [Amycolatopsis sp. SID8362]|uniref:SAM-dependent methyltransferase n=1 Tax=Amycolatopsis sp. SID8362 TaxID=2690346 RepID=UPI00136A124C|nr:class I SAM-dependent methyltransferase [Amycolatopsis sp. SID8362]NBH02983.1 methyltransferase domain-containing protein [Amycolatopsis sp. SID8362]NED39684.1 methyltransferase domain-containing protein [Amycolatopsis sp. SID8362]
MDDELNALRRSRMRWNTPLSEAHAALLLDRLALGEGNLVDLGCGWGELLLRAAARVPGLRATGVDTDSTSLERGRAAARERGLAVEFTEADAATWDGTAERAFCIGAAHAFGSTKAALARLARVVPSGRVLYGDGFWATPPNPAALEIFGPDTLTLPELLDAAAGAGWRVLHVSTADQLEWDDFESTSKLAWQEWLLANPADPRAAEVRDWLDERQRQYVRDYRGVLGLAYLVLGR